MTPRKWSLIGIILAVSSAGKASRPNIVIFMADDLGWADLGCFGNTSVATPNIDSLCRDGAKLTHHLAAASVCTPSRAAFMTGRYPVKTGLVPSGSEFTPPVIISMTARAGLRDTEVTWSRELKRMGYTNALIGKWHLGWDLDWPGDHKQGPLNHGFDYFFGLPLSAMAPFAMNPAFFTLAGHGYREYLFHLMSLCTFYLVHKIAGSKRVGMIGWVFLGAFFFAQWLMLEHFSFVTKEYWAEPSPYVMKWQNSILIEDQKVVEYPVQMETLAGKLTQKAVEFLHQAKDANQPFALFYSFPNVHTPLRPGKRAKGKSQFGPYGDSIIEMDNEIGDVLRSLEKLGLSENTFIYFTSDHGSHIDLGQKGGSNLPYKGGKMMDAFEGSIRVPGIMKWPGVVEPGSTIDVPTSMMDIFPTLLQVASSGKEKVHPGRIDGHSLLPLLNGHAKKSPHRLMRHYCGDSLFALRLVGDEDEPVYKAHFREMKTRENGVCVGGPLRCSCFGGRHVHDLVRQPKIFDLTNDPGEDKPLDKESKLYKELLFKFVAEFETADKELYQSQLSNMGNVISRPWMHPYFYSRFFSAEL